MKGAAKPEIILFPLFLSWAWLRVRRATLNSCSCHVARSYGFSGRERGE